MLNVLTDTTTTKGFLEVGTEFMTWLLTSGTSMLNFLTSNDVTMYFLAAALVYKVIAVVKSFVHM